MGLSPFHSCVTNYNAPAPNPSPSRWALIEKIEFTNSYVLKVRYIDATNFEGIKIMVFKGKYRYKAYLDPHFDCSNDSPIARFKPDSNGWDLAINFAKNL